MLKIVYSYAILLADIRLEMKTKKSAEGQKVRNDANYEKNHIQGRYGAIPFLGNFDTIFEEMINNIGKKTA